MTYDELQLHANTLQYQLDNANREIAELKAGKPAVAVQLGHMTDDEIVAGIEAARDSVRISGLTVGGKSPTFTIDGLPK